MNMRTAPTLRKKALADSQRLKEFGPSPENIFKALRLNADLSLDALSGRCFVSKQALIRLEQGCFSDPLPSVVDYYTRQGHSELQLRDAYLQFQELMRKRHHLLFGPSLEVNIDGEHPLRQLRDNIDYNPTELAKAICMPQSTILHFERKWRTQQSVPKQLLNALSQCGYQVKQLNEFANTYEVWRQLNLSKPKGVTGGGLKGGTNHG